MKKGKKQSKNKQARISDFHKMMNTTSRESKVQFRKETGGYTCPGSNKK